MLPYDRFVQPDERLERVRLLRERGQTPKQIARVLGIRSAEADRLVRAVAIMAQAEAPGPALAGCWIGPAWSAGLTVGDHPGWGAGKDHVTRCRRAGGVSRGLLSAPNCRAVEASGRPSCGTR